MNFNVQEIAAVVAGTEVEERVNLVRRSCKDGAPLSLRREPENASDPNAIGVWMECSNIFGWNRKWKKIGYVKEKRALNISTKIDSGQFKILHAYVRSFSAPDWLDVPRVSIIIELVKVN